VFGSTIVARAAIHAMDGGFGLLASLSSTSAPAAWLSSGLRTAEPLSSASILDCFPPALVEELLPLSARAGRASLGGNRVGLGVVADIGVEAVHDIEARIGESFFSAGRA